MGICVECGLCCDGTLFVRAGLVDTDPLADLVERGATIVTLTTGRRELRLPCPALEDKCCAVYGNRPQICSDFKCRVLEGVESGSITDHAASQIVVDTTAQRDAVREALFALVGGEPTEPMGALYKRLLEQRDSAEDPRDFEQRHADIFMKVAGLRFLLLRHFVSPEPGRTAPWLAS